jgi:two-component system, NtrC family, response regulator AtoC
MPARVLLVGRDHADFSEVEAALAGRGYEVGWRPSAEAALAAVWAGGVDVVIADAELPDTSGVDLCRHLATERPDVRVVLTAAARDFDAAVTAIRAGAFDVLVRPLELDLVEHTIARVMRLRPLREEVQRLRLALAEAKGFEELIGASQPMQRLYDLMERAASTSAAVLITGESGTGKELVARALHKRSRRREGPFVAVNCSAIPEQLLESELFGHVKGAFTDARMSRSGLFVKASGGTIFLDEIGDMPVALQPKLLRALQERVIRPVGGDAEMPFDARLICATNQNLEASVAERTFREDLYYRINVIHIEVPALRDRASDVLLLTQHFLEHYALHSEKNVSALSAEAAQKLLAYPWPGNVRELQNCIERAVALTRHRDLQVEDLPERIAGYRRSHVLVVSNEPSELVPMEEVERRYVLRVLQAVGGNKKEAARILGFDRKTLYRKLERYGLTVDRDKA